MPNAFDHLTINLTEVMRSELEKRDPVVHQALMSDMQERDYERDLERIAMVRTMLVALIARKVGYHGPITGWTRDSNGQYVPADSTWWNFSEEDLPAASTVFVAGGD